MSATLDKPHETEQAESASGELTAWNPLEAIILPAVRSWTLIAVTTGLGLLVGTFLALVKPNEYESRAKIHVRKWLGSSAIPELVVTEESKGPTANADIANQFHLLTSEEVYLEVAQELGPLTILQPYDPAFDDDPVSTPYLTRQLHRFQSWWFGAHQFDREKANDPSYMASTKQIRAAVEVLKANSSVTTDGVSNIIDVMYKTHDPALAQKILDSIIRQHEKRHLEINSVKPVTEIWKAEQAKYTNEWQEATRLLNLFRDKHQVSDLSSQIAALFSEKELLQRELDFGDKNLYEYRKRKLASLKEEFAATNDFLMTEKSTEKIPNQDFVLKYNEWKKQRADLLDLLNIYSPDAKEVVAQRAKIAKLETDMQGMEQEKEIDIPPRRVKNPDYETLENRIEELEEVIAENDVTLETKNGRLEEVKSRLLTLRSLQTEFDELRRQVDRSQYLKSNYESAIAKFSLNQLLEEQSKSNLTVWTPPTIPFRKSGPHRTKLVIASIGGGVFAGFALALVLNVMDRTVRRRKELETLLGVPCLSVVPTTGKWTWRQARRAAKKFPVEEI